MIPVIERSGRMDMAFLTGQDLVNVKKVDAVYKGSDQAWYFKALGEVPKNAAYPEGILGIACKNMQNPGHWFSAIVMDSKYGHDRDSPDFKTLDEAIEWMIINLEELLTEMKIPILGPEWRDIPADYKLFCVQCKHSISYRENRDNGIGQGQYMSCKQGCNPDSNYNCKCRELKRGKV